MRVELTGGMYNCHELLPSERSYKTEDQQLSTLVINQVNMMI